MARTPPPAWAPARSRWLDRGAVVLAVVGTFVLALATMAAAQDSSPAPSPAVTEKPVPLDTPSRPVRVRVPFAGVDLPVISSDRNVAGNPRGYPLCDVAQYWTKYDMPGEPGTSWILAHAQPGMFLPLYEINAETGGKGLIGKLIKLQLRDGRLLTYRITKTKISSNEDIAEPPNKRQQRLVLQTSTGYGSAPKLQVAARLLDAAWTDQPRPDPQPRACWQPTPKPTPKNGNGRNGATPEPVEVIEPKESIEPLALLLGSGAVLLGATVVAIYVVRRP